MKNYTLKLYKNGGRVETFRTKKRKRFFKILRTIKWQLDGVRKAYLKMSYGQKLDNYGKLSDFYNDGYYDNKEELLRVFKYFDQEE